MMPEQRLGAHRVSQPLSRLTSRGAVTTLLNHRNRPVEEPASYWARRPHQDTSPSGAGSTRRGRMSLSRVGGGGIFWGRGPIQILPAGAYWV